MIKHHDIGDIFFTDDSMKIEIDAVAHSFRLVDISTKLSNASPTERQRYEVSPSGYGIHWPLIDEDLSIDGLLNIKHAPPFSKMKAA